VVAGLIWSRASHAASMAASSWLLDTLLDTGGFL
jgi:hypothetical protein